MDMMRIFSMTMGAALLLPADAQWPAERHPMFDICSPQKEQPEAPASQLCIHITGENRLTGGQLPQQPRNADESLQLHAWRGERSSAQLAVEANGRAPQLTATCTGLSNGHTTIPVRVNMLRYTKAHGTPVADVIDHSKCCDNPAGVVRGLWLQVDVPQNAEPGTYQGEIAVSSAGSAPATRKITLHVAPEKLPTPDQWHFHLDLWQHPQAVARWHDVEPWSPEHFALLRPIMKRLAEAGQKSITCTLLDEAWNGQTYDWFPSLVKWIRGKDGQMRYDYTGLDKWVRFMHDEIGIREQISCYTMIPWHLSVQVFNEATGCYEQVKARPGEPAYEAIWAPFLRDFHRHMKQNGWAEKTCIAIDERPDHMVREAMRLVATHAPAFRIASAVDKPSALTRDVYNISPVITHAGSALGDLLRERKAAGKITTFYVCLHPQKPNTFTHSPMAEAEWLGLFAAANHLDGFLRWAYNSWNRNPFETTDFVHWPSGDCFLVYPGNRSSIRFERLRDGIEDYEKINQLRARAAASPEATEIIRRMDAQLAEIFSVERSKGQNHAADVARAHEIITATASSLRKLNKNQ